MFNNEKFERNAEIVRMVANGEGTLDAIGAKFAITRERVRQIALREGVRSQHSTPPLTLDEKTRISELAYRGMPHAHIGETVGRSDTTVTAYLVEIGLHKPAQDDKTWTEKETAFLRAHYKTPGWSATKIGAKLGRTRDECIGKANRLGLCDPEHVAQGAKTQAQEDRRGGQTAQARADPRRYLVQARAPDRDGQCLLVDAPHTAGRGMNRPAPSVPQVYVDRVTKKKKVRVVQQVVKRKLTGKPDKRAEAEALFKGNA